MPTSRWLFTILLLLPVLASADVSYPLGVVPFNLDYQLAYRVALASGDVDRWPAIGPFFHSTVERILEDEAPTPAMALTDDPSGNRMRLLTITSERLQAERGSRSRDLFLFSGGLRYQPSGYFGALVLFNLDRAKAVDPDYTGKKWRGLAGNVETAGLYFKKGNLAVTLGRERVFWGPQPINLILSETAEPLDLLSARFRKGRLHFSCLFARLEE
ncbi:MAG: hypothetical protein ACE5K8_05650, partial [Candidatus Zixiibacteriota bacterium]